MATGLAKLCFNVLIGPALVVLFWPAMLCAWALWSAVSSVSVCELKQAATTALEAAIVEGLYLRGRHQNAAPLSLRRLPRMPLVRISHMVGLAAAAA